MNQIASGLFLALSLSAPALAGSARPGFSTEPLEFVPPVFNATATLNDTGEAIVFDGNTIERVGVDGTTLQVYATLPAFSYPSFLVLSPDRSYAVAGESTSGEIFFVDLDTGTISSLGTLDYNYDGVIGSDGFTYVSAATGTLGFNEVWRIDARAGGSFERIVEVPGFSGPLAVEPDGDLLVALAENPDRVVRFTEAQLGGGVLLIESDGELVTTNWNGLSFMTVDPKSGVLIVAEHDFVTFTDPATIYLARADKSTSTPVYEADPGLSIGKLELFGSGLNRAVFAPFQPERGGTLLFTLTDFFSVTERRVVRPHRPTSALAGAGATGTGAVTYVCDGGLPDASLLLFYGLTADNSPYELPIQVGGLPLFWTLNPLALDYVKTRIPTDSNGRASFDFTNSGVFTGLVTLQPLLVDGQGLLVGSAPAVSL